MPTFLHLLSRKRERSARDDGRALDPSENQECPGAFIRKIFGKSGNFRFGEWTLRVFAMSDREADPLHSRGHCLLTPCSEPCVTILSRKQGWQLEEAVIESVGYFLGPWERS